MCKNAFLSLYGVIRKIIARIQSLIWLGVSPNDKKRNQSNQIIIDISIVQQIKKHIVTFTLKKSYYSSEDIQY